MSEADLARIEDTLGIRLRPDYRAFLLAHADDLRRAEAEFAWGMVPHHDPDLIIEHNQAVRERPDCWMVEREDGSWVPFPSDFFVVGGDVGDWWYIHRDGPDLGLWFLAHDGYSNTRSYDSFEEFAAELRRDLDDPQCWRRDRS